MSAQQRKILVITSCTKDKVFPSHLSPVLAGQLWDESDDDRVVRNYGELEKYRMTAADLYHGLQHTELMQAVRLLRRTFGATCVEVKIISAGFGVVEELTLLPPYEATFAGLSTHAITALSPRLRIPQRINELMSGSYDCAFFLLGETYLLSLGLPFNSDPSFPCLFLASPKSLLPTRHPYYRVPTGKDESIAFRYNMVGLKGHLFRLFAEQMVVPERWESFFLTPTPQFFLSAIQPVQRSHQSESSQVVQLPLFTSASAKVKIAKNYGRPMRFFVPDWDDLVDPGYDFERDLPAPQRKRYESEVYAHQIYQETNVDGLLFSRCTVENGKAKTERVRAQGIHAFARFGKSIMGDCGAFSYITEDIPPYQTPELLDYYQALGFDYGVSLDHLIVPHFTPLRNTATRSPVKMHANFYVSIVRGITHSPPSGSPRDGVPKRTETL
jgi:hypothetical protein